MYNHAPRDYVCPICQIVRGETTEKGSAVEVLFRDDLVTVFVAGRFMRSNPGHVIVVPNDHFENLYDLPQDAGHRIIDMTKKIALILKKAYECDGTSTTQHNEPAGYQDALHYHQHVFPRYEGDNLYANHKDSYWPSAEEKKPYTDKLKPYFDELKSESK